jgi:hypothetical protein
MIRSSAIVTGLVIVLRGASLVAQADAGRLESSSAPVAVLAAALYNDQANVREASDSAMALLATDILRTRLRDRLGDQVVAFDLIDSLAASPTAVELTGGVPCQVKVACARAVATAAGARWVVLAKVSKTSNLIWLLSAQLIRASTGEIILDDSTELKGEPAPMVRVGVRSFADRVVRTVRNGGYATDFPEMPTSP